jgi:hypothetical protein
MKESRFLSVLVSALGIALLGGCGKSEKPVASPAAPPAPAVQAMGGSTTSTTELDGLLVEVVHSKLDMGQIKDLFDGDNGTLIRTENAKTALFDLAFQGTKKVSGVEVKTSTMDVGLKVTLTATGKPDPVVFSETLLGKTDPTISVDFGGTYETSRIKLEISNLNEGDGHVHLYEVKFK